MVYDILGREIKTLINEVQNAGYKSAVWNGTNDFGEIVSSGVYIYKIVAGTYVNEKKMIFIK